MRPRKLAAAALLIVLASASGWACDSYDDDMSLASVLTRAVAEARANGTLQAAEAKAPASQSANPEQPAPPAAEAGAAAAPKS